MTFQFKRSLCVAALAGTLGMAGCGGGGGSSTGNGNSGGPGSTNPPGGGTPGTSSGTQVSGVVASGLVGGGLVTATCGATSVGTATTAADGSYTLSLSQDCSAPILLTVTPPTSGTMAVADEVIGATTVGPLPLASGESWMLRAYANPTTAATATSDPVNNTKHITPFTDMAVAIVAKVTSLTSSVTANGHTQQPIALSAGLVNQATQAIAYTVLGTDPGGVMQLTSSAPAPIDPAKLSTDPAVSPVGQQQQDVLLAALSVWANPNTGNGPIFNPTTSSTCGDPVVCGSSTASSALKLMEDAITSEIGAHLFVGDTTGSSVLVANASASPMLPAVALQNVAAQIETAGSGVAGAVPANIAAAAQGLVAANQGNSVSGLFYASQWYITLSGITF